jgi:hypothetical protein
MEQTPASGTAKTDLLGRPCLQRTGQSVAGVTCLIMAMVACVSQAGVLAIERAARTYARSGGGEEYILPFLLLCASALFAGVTGFVAGVVCLMQRKRKRMFGLIGMPLVVLLWPYLFWLAWARLAADWTKGGAP